MQLIKGDGRDDGEPMDRWTVVRTWRGVEANSYSDALDFAVPGEHTDVQATREQTSAQLYDTEIVTLSLCRFTGQPQGLQQVCDARLHRRHPDVDCYVSFIPMDLIVGALPHDEQSAALAFLLGETPEDLRVPYAWGANPLQGSVQDAQAAIERDADE